MKQTKAGSYHIRFPDSVTDWLEEKRKAMGYDYVQDVVRHLIHKSYLDEKNLATVTPKDGQRIGAALRGKQHSMKRAA